MFPLVIIVDSCVNVSGYCASLIPSILITKGWTFKTFSLVIIVSFCARLIYLITKK